MLRHWITISLVLAASACQSQPTTTFIGPPDSDRHYQVAQSGEPLRAPTGRIGPASIFYLDAPAAAKANEPFTIKAWVLYPIYLPPATLIQSSFKAVPGGSAWVVTGDVQYPRFVARMGIRYTPRVVAFQLRITRKGLHTLRIAQSHYSLSFPERQYDPPANLRVPSPRQNRSILIR